MNDALVAWVCGAQSCALFFPCPHFFPATFHAVYYANADPVTAARSIGINEAMVGAGSTLGPLAMGLLAWRDFASPRPYWVLAAMLAAAAIWMGVDGIAAIPAANRGSLPDE